MEDESNMSEHERMIIYEDRYKCAQVTLARERAEHERLFDYFNERYPDEMGEFLSTEPADPLPKITEDCP